MIHEEKQKLYDDLKNLFIEKHGNLFLKLSDEDQNKMIMSVIESHIAKLKIDFE